MCVVISCMQAWLVPPVGVLESAGPGIQGGVVEEECLTVLLSLQRA